MDTTVGMTDLIPVTDVTTELAIDMDTSATLSDLPETNAITDIGNSTNVTNLTNQEWPELPLTVFEIFIVIEILMLVVELSLSLVIALKMKQWRRNYRNQMLTQISVARFMKRIIGFVIFLEKTSATREESPSFVNLSLIIYFNFVLVFLIFFLIKHMHATLIVVFVKVRKNNLYMVSLFAWLFPVLLTCSWIACIMFYPTHKWLVDIVFCILFKWSLTIVGTILYICVLTRISSDRMRHFAKNLAVITFMLCLTINVYIITADVSRLFRSFLLNMMKYVFGFVFNFLVLCLYVALVSSNFRHRIKHCDTMSSHSAGATNGEVPAANERCSVKRDSKHMSEDYNINER